MSHALPKRYFASVHNLVTQYLDPNSGEVVENLEVRRLALCLLLEMKNEIVQALAAQQNKEFL